MEALFIGILGGLELMFMPIMALALGFFIFALLDLIKRPFEDNTKKIIWALVILLIPFLVGPILYFVFGRNRTNTTIGT